MTEATRQDLRLDEAHSDMLEQLADADDATVSDVLRKMIATTYEKMRKARRMEAALRIGALEIEAMPEPEELSRQLAAKYDFERLH